MLSSPTYLMAQDNSTSEPYRFDRDKAFRILYCPTLTLSLSHPLEPQLSLESVQNRQDTLGASPRGALPPANDCILEISPHLEAKELPTEVLAQYLVALYQTNLVLWEAGNNRETGLN